MTIRCGQEVTVELPGFVATGWIESIDPEPDIPPEEFQLGKKGDIILRVRVTKITTCEQGIKE